MLSILIYISKTQYQLSARALVFLFHPVELKLHLSGLSPSTSKCRASLNEVTFIKRWALVKVEAKLLMGLWSLEKNTQPAGYSVSISILSRFVFSYARKFNSFGPLSFQGPISDAGGEYCSELGQTIDCRLLILVSFVYHWGYLVAYVTV